MIKVQSDWLVETGTTQNVANTVWAFATLKAAAPKLVRLDELIENGNTQVVAITGWATTIKAETE